MDPDVLRIAQVLMLAGMASVAGFALWTGVRVVNRLMGRRPERDGGGLRVEDARFTRLEQSLESIAIEVERIAEAQRFQAKLMLEKSGDAPAVVPALREPRGD